MLVIAGWLVSRAFNSGVTSVTYANGAEPPQVNKIEAGSGTTTETDKK